MLKETVTLILKIWKPRCPPRPEAQYILRGCARVGPRSADQFGSPGVGHGRPAVAHGHSCGHFRARVNDYAPIFTRPSYSVAVAEDAAPDSSILQVQALDMDGSAPNNVIAYRIQSGARDKFVIDSTTGVVSVALGATLDPDQTHPRTVRYQLEILALDGGVGSRQLHASVTVMISVADVNNKSPVLAEPGVVRVQENVTVGVVLTQLVATDPDERPIIRYWIDHAASEGRNEKGFLVRDENVTSWFEINTNDGRIRVVRQMNREKAETVRLAIRAEDVAAATTGQTASGTMAIILEDDHVNDHDPIFVQPFYRRSVAENGKRGAAILTLSADDADLNRSITYSLDGPAELLELVHLNSETGEVVVSGKLDRERFAWMNLTAKASDSGMPKRSSFVPVFIQILDENDNNPIFACVPSTVTGTVQAYDLDIGDFGHVTYLMDRRSSKVRFSVDPETGVIIVTERLDQEEQQSYTLILEAVQVIDENDETPVFEARSGCVSVTEFHDSRVPLTTIHASDRDDPPLQTNATVGSVITSVLAVDQDAGLNSKVRYSIRPVGNWKWFEIDSVTESRREIPELPLGSQPTWTLPFTFEMDIDILHWTNLSNVNDHQPQFPLDVFQVNITEHVPSPEIIQLPETVDLDEPDELLSTRDPVCFFIVGGNQLGAFSIDPTQHTLRVEKTLDREEQATHVVVVKASENCNLNPEIFDSFDPADDSLLKVIVNSTLSTRTDQEEHIGANPFVIDRDIGIISLNFDPQRDMKGYFYMEVYVNDSSGFDDTARDYNVLDTSAAEPLGDALTSVPQNFSLLWASGTAVFLAMILVLGLCVSQRLVLMRKLKSASVTAFGSQSNVNRTSNQVPNTNQLRFQSRLEA
ncbi:hypothetical protein DAPPUDRAFT_300008 [Daphnia pulex]|uniref:Cadherin domain-containing protein n=1 Tax=Daphnia pulex TaxID=6669 RepID=E9FRR7_DAPPU|nr:hypothetical protein DAPPUDRAFT_300008 [Daphnia pulex]|eukprot:EFX90438.1 hypothetical protein DAPPUDRAFT_300008 [Daphnia pulex]